MDLRNSYPGYNSNFGNAAYDINRGAKDNQLECLKKFGKASLVPYPHPETLEWIVDFDHPQIGRVEVACFFSNKEDAIAFVDFHNWTHN